VWQIEQTLTKALCIRDDIFKMGMATAAAAAALSLFYKLMGFQR
jgi:hypothetical protein